MFQQQLMTRLAALPAGKSINLDREFNAHGTITLLDQGTTSSKQYPNVPIEGIPATYLETIGTPLILGRAFTTDEVNAKAPVIGVPASLAVARLLSSMLIGLTTTDAPPIGVVTALLVAVTMLACYLPARRATRVDPLETLRYE